jgi:hypothetical protein
VIEHEGITGHWLAVSGTAFVWTPDPYQAIRFARAEDAIAVRSTLTGEQDQCCVSKRQWVGK